MYEKSLEMRRIPVLAHPEKSELASSRVAELARTLTMRGLRSAALAALALGIAVTTSRGLGQTLGSDFDAVVAQTMRPYGLPGVVVVVVRGDKLIHLRGYGRP